MGPTLFEVLEALAVGEVMKVPHDDIKKAAECALSRIQSASEELKAAYFEIDALKARAVAAEVVIVEAINTACNARSYEDYVAKVGSILQDTPDLTAARELIRKAGEADMQRVMLDAHEETNEELWRLFGCPEGFSLADSVEALIEERDGLALLVGELRRALEESNAAMWDSHYGGGIAVEYARSVSVKVSAAQTIPLPEAAKQSAAMRALVDAVLAFDDLNESAMGGGVDFGEFDRKVLPLLRARDAAIAALKDARRSQG